MKFKPEVTIKELNSKIPWNVNPVWAECDIGPGWIKMVSRLVDDLNEMDCDYTVGQVKEKFGGLRFYYDAVHADNCPGIDSWVECPLYKRVSKAEKESYYICESCGGRTQETEQRGPFGTIWRSFCGGCKP